MLALGKTITTLAVAVASLSWGASCPDGYFQIDGPPLFPSESEPLDDSDAIGVREGLAGLLSGCNALAIRTRPATRVVTLRWDPSECGFSRRLRLRAKFTRDCATLVGKLTEKPRRFIGRRTFTATRSNPPPHGADPTFGYGGEGNLPFEQQFDPEAIAALPDGGVVIAGWVSGGGGARLARFGRDGRLDSSFAENGVASIVGASWSHVLPEADGRIVVGGVRDGRFLIARYTASGALDASFGIGGMVVGAPDSNSSLFDVARDPSGGFVIAGRRSCPADPSDGCGQLLRLDADGKPDPAFGSDGYVIVPPLLPDEFGAGIALTAVTVEPDRSVLTAGVGNACPSSDPFPALGCQVLARFDAGGTPDASFGNAGMAVDVLQPDPNLPSRIMRDDQGRILVLGGLRNWYYVRIEHGLTRYTAAGLLDASFGSGGLLMLPPFTDVVPRPGGGYVAAVASSGFVEAQILRLTADWLPDPDFGQDGRIGMGEIVRFIAMTGHPDGRISIASQFYSGSVYRRLP